jgi:hypothetical protein
MRILLFLLLTTRLFAGEIKYPASAIPEELKQNNYAVIRESVEEFKILSVNRSSYYVREVITILNQNGNVHARKMIGYDPLHKIQMLNASIYDAAGVLIKKIKPSEIVDQSSFDGFSLFSDDRIKRIDLRQNSYPYTIFFEYQLEIKFLYSIPDFQLYTDDEVGIQHASYSIVYPPALKPRYKMFGVSEPKITTEAQYERLTWQFENIKPNRWEKFSPNHSKFVPTIIAAPNQFEYEGYAGKMDSWENLGKWQLSLNKGRDILPEPTKLKIRELTKGKTDIDKIKILYQFMQNKTRYVGIQLGIGGLQPFEAKVVDEVGYGDCKALSNYMVSLLNEVGIKGYYSTIYAGEEYEEMVTDFPSHHGNHVIVSVPMSKDTIWLECTDQTQPFNYLGTFTGNRYALMATENGGKVVKTPSYSKTKNVQARKAQIVVNTSGKANASIHTVYNGILYDRFSVGRYSVLGGDRQKEWIEENVQISSFDIISYSFKNHTEQEPTVEVDLKLHLPNCATVQGKRLFLLPNIMNRVTWIPEKTQNRKTDIVFKYPSTEVDSIEFTIPEEFYPEYLPPPVKISSRFGDYEASFTTDQGKIIYLRKFSQINGTFPKESYSEFVDFYKAINKADLTKVVFLNRT